jgi:phosphatidylserine/phosphatidylglycerophosphate/cardiolipin synthase-like enzyme
VRRRLFPLRRDGLRLTSRTAWASPSAGPEGSDHDWFLTASERGNSAARIRAWTEGNAVRPLVHGRAYFTALARALEGAVAGDLVLFTDWRGDPDERLEEDGPTVAEALVGAVRRGATVRDRKSVV